MTLAPALGVLLVRHESAFAGQIRGADAGVEALRQFCGWVARRMVSRPGLYSLISLAVVVTLTVNYLSLQPRYRLADEVPNKQHAVQAATISTQSSKAPIRSTC